MNIGGIASVVAACWELDPNARAALAGSVANTLAMPMP
jgi:hypothetical protein